MQVVSKFYCTYEHAYEISIHIAVNVSQTEMRRCCLGGLYLEGRRRGSEVRWCTVSLIPSVLHRVARASGAGVFSRRVNARTHARTHSWSAARETRASAATSRRSLSPTLRYTDRKSSKRPLQRLSVLRVVHIEILRACYRNNFKIIV